MAEELDGVIAAGDGTTRPQGISVASGTADITPASPTTGAVAVGDLLDLMFGIEKQYRIPAWNPRYLMTDGRYKSHRVLATGVTGDARLLHGMSVQSYSLLESIVSIEQNKLTHADGVFGAMKKYRLWRRAGVSTQFEMGGDTLTRQNTALLYTRARFAGRVVDAAAFAVIDPWPSTV